MKYNDYQKENDELLQFLLEKRFFQFWNEDEYAKKINFSDGAQLELFLTNTCNQKCEYCYLCDNESLYPKEINNPDIIINNLKLIYNWIINNKYHLPSIKLFSGEIWHTQFGLDVLDVTSQALQQGLKCDTISIPSNGSFVMDSLYFAKIQNYIDLFANYNTTLSFSLSIDGAYVDSAGRPFNDDQKIKDENYYDRILSFAIHNGFGFHPMISPNNINNWPKNWEWWKDITNKYGYNFPFSAIMMLEVRNEGWTNDTIKQYCDFLKILFKDALAIEYDNNINDMACSLLGNGTGLTSYDYVPCILSTGLTIPSCSIGDTLTIRVGDLSICPCHRLATSKNLYGYFSIEDGKINKIISNNVSQAVRILFGNNTLLSPKCTTCTYKDVCLKGCFGSQYESSNDPFLPIESVCNFMKAKSYTVASLYYEYGIIDIIKQIPASDIRYIVAQELIQKCERVKQDYEKNILEKI